MAQHDETIPQEDANTLRFEREGRTHRDPALEQTLVSSPDSWEPVPVNLGESVLDLEGFDARYELRKLLGAGGMGEVKLFRDERIGREVAVKVSHIGESGPSRERFLREARITAQLEHPSIVPVYDIGLGPDGEPYFTMKRVRGLTLESILDRLEAGDPEAVERFTQRKLLIALSQVCLAMAYAHERGVLHRDLKPANIMLGDFGEVYVMDWGLAKVAGVEVEDEEGVIALDLELEEAVEVISEGVRAPTLEGSVLGTPGYMAPEQVRGEVAAMDARTDVYAIGSMVFEVLTLMPLHQAATPQAAMIQTISGVEARPSVRAPSLEIAPELEAICVRATALEADARFQSARDLHDAIEGFLEGDRDIELRREMARVHAETARLATERALSAEGMTLEARQEAMQALGRALALDPQNTSAVRDMARLLVEPPAETPDAVLEELESSREAQLVLANKMGSPSLFVVYAFFPLMLWMGVRDWTVVASSGAAFFASQLLMFCIGRYQWRSVALQFVVFGLSMIGVGISSRFFGPLIMLPTLVVGITMSYALIHERSHRMTLLLFGVLALCGPLALELMGVISPSYTFEGGMMQIIPHAVSLPGSASMAFLLFASLSVLVTPTLFLGQIRKMLDASERKLLMQSWQLRQLVPEEAASALEPANVLPEKPAAVCKIMPTASKTSLDAGSP